MGVVFKAEDTRLGRFVALIDDCDAAIAAHALAEDSTLVTDNTARMKRIPALRMENWMKPKD